MLKIVELCQYSGERFLNMSLNLLPQLLNIIPSVAELWAWNSTGATMFCYTL